MAHSSNPASKRIPPLVYILLAGLAVIAIVIFSGWTNTAVTPSGLAVPETRPATPPVMPQQPTADSGGVPATTGG